MNINTRIRKLEERAPKEIPCVRTVVIGVPPCADHHIVGATVDGRYFKRMPGESVDDLTDRAVATVTEWDGWIVVSLNSPCYESGGNKCRDVGGMECRGRDLAKAKGTTPRSVTTGAV